MPNKKVIVTGGAGMVGSHVVEFYAGQGAEVTLFDNLDRSRIFAVKGKSVENTWEAFQGKKGIRCVQGDVRKPKDLTRAFQGGADLVVHAAAQPGVGFSVDEPLADFEINALGTLNVLEATRKHAKDAVFIYCSTNKIYGENVSQIPLVEKSKRYVFSKKNGVDEALSTDRTGHTPYGVSKYAGDLYVQEYSHSYGLRTAVFRMSCIYGPRQYGFEDQGWLAHFVTSALKKRPVVIYGDGKQVRDCLYVDDLVRAFDAFFSGSAKSAVFNIGGGQDFTLSLLELLELIERETGEPLQHSFKSWRPSDQKVYISDISRVSRALGWKPQVAPREGVKRLIQWVREHLEELP